ncbi:unnamed protein product [Fusarium graminearum]|nr:unnamed protein product [Fusarium graminearum]CAG1979112.1 unnamed protein product [Fusarium graminearum]CAG1993285.1 unnamed protein product [Fusarium graminearum]VTO87037.1 unnamed protein product [Fusarium graminearum]
MVPVAGRAALPGLGGPAARLARLNRDGDELALGGELSWVEWHGPGSEELMLEGRLVLGTEWGEIWGMTVVNVRTVSAALERKGETEPMPRILHAIQ